MRNGFMVVETTNVIGSKNISMQYASDIENGAIVGKGALVAGETQVYTAIDSYADGMYLVANPAWSYDNNRVTDQNEENYINKAGVPFRTYKLDKDMKFKIYNIDSDTVLAKGDYVEYTSGAWAKAAGTTKLQVVAIEEVGFPYCIGSYGVDTTIGTTGYGYTLGAPVKKYTIEVVA